MVSPPFVATPLRLHPFRALMLNQGRIGEPAAARAFARPYRGVTERLKRWEEEGRLHHDPSPALYLHEYTAGGLTIRGLVGAVGLSHRDGSDAERAIAPHEGIHPEQVAELADRMYEMQLNPAPILLVHRGPLAVRNVMRRVRTSRPPDHAFTDRAEQQHRIWAIRDKGTLETIASALARAQALIADGHHRYAAYLALRDRHPGTPWDRGLAMLVDQDESPLFLGPIHRHLSGVTFDELTRATRDAGFDLVSCPEGAAVTALCPDTLVVTDGERWGSLLLGAETSPQRGAVEVLHQKVLAALPGPGPSVGYHHSVEQALAKTAADKGLALLMPAPDFDLVSEIVAHHRLLPEKATSFQPKPSVGVLMRSVRDEVAGR